MCLTWDKHTVKLSHLWTISKKIHGVRYVTEHQHVTPVDYERELPRLHIVAHLHLRFFRWKTTVIHTWLSQTHLNKTSHFEEIPTVDTLMWSTRLLSVMGHQLYDHRSLQKHFFKIKFTFFLLAFRKSPAWAFKAESTRNVTMRRMMGLSGKKGTARGRYCKGGDEELEKTVLIIINPSDGLKMKR